MSEGNVGVVCERVRACVRISMGEVDVVTKNGLGYVKVLESRRIEAYVRHSFVFRSSVY